MQAKHFSEHIQALETRTRKLQLDM